MRNAFSRRKLGYTALLFYCGLAFTNGMAFSQSPPEKATWKQQKVAFSFQKTGFLETVKWLADKLDRSFVVEGEPLQQSFSYKGEDAAEHVLVLVCDAFDYDWTETKAGVILLRKRFHKRGETPQIVASELQEGISEMMSSLHVLDVSPTFPSSLQDHLASLARSFAPTMLERLRQGEQVSLADLSAAQLSIARKAVYAHLFQSTARRWQMLNDSLKSLGQSFIEKTPSNQGSEQIKNLIRLQLKSSSYRFPIPLYEISGYSDTGEDVQGDEENATAATSTSLSQPKSNSETSTPTDTLRGRTTLREAVRALAQLSGLKLEASPALASRRLIVQFRKVTPRQAMEALAELEGWEWRPDAPDSFLLSRRRLASPGNLDDVLRAFRNAIPNDLQRFLTAAPKRKKNENVFNSGIPAYVGHEIAVRNMLKLDELLFSKEKQLAHSLADRLEKEKSVSYRSLTAEQQDLLALILTLQACSSSILDLTSILDKPTLYETNPEKAFLTFHISGATRRTGELRIGSDYTSTQRGGAFGSSFPFEEMAPPPVTISK